MQSGAYKRNDNLYLYVGLARSHDTNQEVIVYVPLLHDLSGQAQYVWHTAQLRILMKISNGLVSAFQKTKVSRYVQ